MSQFLVAVLAVVVSGGSALVHSRPFSSQNAPVNQPGVFVNKANQSPGTASSQAVARTNQATEPTRSALEQYLGKFKTDPLVGITIALAMIAIVQVGVYVAMHRTTMRVERAYVTISHYAPFEPPHMLSFHEPSAVWFAVEIRNHGRTPADLIGGMIAVETAAAGANAPEQVPTGQYAVIPPAFLVPDSFVHFRSMVFLDESVVHSVMNGDTDLWLVGSVNYRDRFNKTHRGGYGRHYDRHTHDLVFDLTTRAFNYDRHV